MVFDTQSTQSWLAVLQEAARLIDGATPQPRVFALYTSHRQTIGMGLVAEPHIVARAHNFEWIFDKTEWDIDARGRQVAGLAECVSLLPHPWPKDHTEAATGLKTWLQLSNDVSWHQTAWEDVVRCHPPIHEFAQHTHSICAVRWALHRVWPYPTFLLDDIHLAARMWIDPGSFKNALASNSRFADLFNPAQFGGALSDFAGRRWWRAGVDSVIFELAEEDPASLKFLHGKLKEIEPNLVCYSDQAMFPVIGSDFKPRASLASASLISRVLPDDWPPFADTAWALKTDIIDDAGLAAIRVMDEEQ